jgi:N-acylneuraminate cytidylyltransferase/CMP-N,N'-diacetyllegionaminic acid synthase
MQVLYIIPARGGSKGLPGKNSKDLAGKPMIAYSILAALNSHYKGRVVVSTDDMKIAEVSKQYGAEVPFMRPAELSTDSASTLDAIVHAIEYYKKENIFFDLVVLLQPTSPLRTSADIDNSIDLFKQKKASAIVSVCENEHHPLWSNTLPEDGSMKDFMREEVKGKNRQQLPKNYRLNGAVYVSTTEDLIKQKGFIHEGTYAYIMPVNRSIDIDHEMDFKLAELLMKND